MELKGLRPKGPYWSLRERRLRFDELRFDHHVLEAAIGAVRYRLNEVRVSF